LFNFTRTTHICLLTLVSSVTTGLWAGQAGRAAPAAPGTPTPPAGNSPASADLSVVFTPAPKETDTIIKGSLSGSTADISRVTSVFVDVLNGSDVAQGPFDGAYSASDQTFSVTGLNPLAEGQTVLVRACGSPSGAVRTGTIAAADLKTIQNVPGDLTSLVVGWPVNSDALIPAGTTITKVDTAGKTVTISQSGVATPVATFEFGDTAGGSCVQTHSNNTKPLEAIPTKSRLSAEVDSQYDLGRFRAYFSVGAELEGSQGSLGTTSGFLALNLDDNWYASNTKSKLNKNESTDSVCYSPRDSPEYKAAVLTLMNGEEQDPDQVRAAPDRGCAPFVHHWMLNTYVQGEALQLPVTTTSGTSSISGLSSAKGASVEGGVYAPLMFGWTQWRFHGQANALFVAPLGKYGFLVPGATPAGAPNLNAYRAWSFGVRLGHFRLPAHLDRHQPELLTYLDLTGGEWENFRDQGGKPGVRFDATGRFKLPFTPFFIGFDSNVGAGANSFGIFAGLRVDGSKLLAKFIPSTPTGN